MSEEKNQAQESSNNLDAVGSMDFEMLTVQPAVQIADKSNNTVAVKTGTNNALATTVTDGTNFMPVMDGPLRPGYMRLADGTNQITLRSLTGTKALDVSIVDGTGAQITSFGGGTQFAEDTALGSTPTGTLSMARRTDTLATLTPVVDDAISLRTNNRGALWVQLDTNTASTVVALSTQNSASGTITTNTSTVVLSNVNAYPFVRVTIDGTYAGISGVFEAFDNTNWIALAAVRNDTTQVDYQFTTLSNTVRAWFVNTTGYNQFRVRATAYTSGTANIRILANSIGAGGFSITGLSDGTNTAGVASGTNKALYTVHTDGTNLMPTMDAVGRAGFLKITDGTNTATLRSVGSSKALDVSIVDGSGNQITSFGGGTQYAEAATAATATGTVSMWKDSSNTIRAAGLATPFPIQFSDGTNLIKAADNTNNAIRVNIVAGAGSGGTAIADRGTFTLGTTNLTPAGGVFDDTPPTALTTGMAGTFRVTANRAQHINLRNASGTEIGTTSNPVNVTMGTTAVNGFVGISTPNALAGSPAAYANITPYGSLRISDEPSTLFYDPFDGAVDTTNKWNSAVTASGGSFSQTAGTQIFTSGTTNSGSAYITSQASFVQSVPGFLQVSWAMKWESGTVNTNCHRFFGVGTSTAFTATTPLTDAIGWEIDTTGKLRACVYANGTRLFGADLSSSGTNTQPTDGGFHRYICIQRTDRIAWYIDTLDNMVATTSWNTPQVQTLPIRVHVINTAAGTTSSTLTCTGIAAADTARNAHSISDGTYGWRKASVTAAGALHSNLRSSTGTELLVTPTLSTVPSIPATTQQSALYLQTSQAATTATTQTLTVGSLANGTNQLFSAAIAQVTVTNPSGAAQTITGLKIYFSDTINAQTATINYIQTGVSIAANSNQTFVVPLSSGYLATMKVDVTYTSAPTASGNIVVQSVLQPSSASTLINTSISTVNARFTAATTNTVLVTASSTQRIVVTRVLITASNANTADVGVVLGFNSSTLNTPSTTPATGILASAAAIPAGGGFAFGDGGLLGIGAPDEDLRITTSAAQTVDVNITYYFA